MVLPSRFEGAGPSAGLVKVPVAGLRSDERRVSHGEEHRRPAGVERIAQEWCSRKDGIDGSGDNDFRFVSAELRVDPAVPRPWIRLCCDPKGVPT